MRICLNCHNRYPTSLDHCSSCGHSPVIIDGLRAYAPDIACNSSGFKESYFSDLSRLEERHFWFKVRNEIIVWAMKKYVAEFDSMLEIGCGTGFVLKGISDFFPKSNLNGSEIFLEGLSFASKRLPNANLMQMDARNIPFFNEFDIVGSFDVLEHIKEDEKVLEEIHESLKQDGFLFLTVPQHKWLWSSADEYACHERRYSKHEIEQKVIAAGFSILRSTSFISLLLPIMIASRLIKKGRRETFDPLAELKISSSLNWLFERILKVEVLCLKFGINFSAGGSRLIVAQKICK